MLAQFFPLGVGAALSEKCPSVPPLGEDSGSRVSESKNSAPRVGTPPQPALQGTAEGAAPPPPRPLTPARRPAAARGPETRSSLTRLTGRWGTCHP